MKLKLFGDTAPIDWQALGVRMPFAPMHELAKKYESELEQPGDVLFVSMPAIMDKVDYCRTFELPSIEWTQLHELYERIRHRTENTISALDQCTADTVCINLGGGYHHAGRYPDSGYAYSLINDHIWAVDYQRGRANVRPIQILDWDHHLPGGTMHHYQDASDVLISGFPGGYTNVLYKHQHLLGLKFDRFASPAKILFNIGTDVLQTDELFGNQNGLSMADYFDMVTQEICKILYYQTPLAITFGGSYGEAGLQFYEMLISWLKAYEPSCSRLAS